MPGHTTEAAALILLASAAEQQGDLQTARELYRQLVASSPDHAAYVLALMHCQVALQSHEAALDAAHSLAAVRSGSRGMQDAEGHLDAAAVSFTALKTLFCLGRLEEAHAAVAQLKQRRLLALISCTPDAPQLPVAEGPQARAGEVLHSHVKNEAIYCAFIVKLLDSLPPTAAPAPPTATGRVFLCGDSHTLSGAWHHMQLHGQHCVAVPKLVSGCKIWHLRPQSSSKFKAAWVNAIRTIPDHSTVHHALIVVKVGLQRPAQVVFMLGELECRKHLSGLPESQLAAHISQLIDVLLSIALGLIRARHFCVALHPVWPILAWSRDAVKAFNDQLASKCTATVLQEQLQSRLCCVSIKELLDGDGQLEQQYWLDGVHAAPAAWQAVAGCLSQLQHGGNVEAS